MPYSVSLFDTSAATTFTILDQQADSSQIPLALVGRGAVSYGQATAQNFIRLLENFASPDDGSGNPTALNALKPLTGQVWFDKTIGKLKVNTGTQNSPTWEIVGKPPSNTSQPTSPQSGDIWYDATNGVLRVWNGSAFITVGPQTITLTGDVTGAGTGTFAATLSNTGVTPGTYTSVTVDAKGRITSASNASAPFVRLDASSSPTTDDTFSVGDSLHRFHNVYSTTFTGEATSADYADLAERYEASEPVEPGDLVALGGSKEICKTVGYMSPDVFGVISTAPAIMMNAKAGTDETHPFVALSGRVPVKVLGQVRKGQRLCASSVAGVATAIDLSEAIFPFSIFGRALADKTTSDIGLVEVVVGVK